MMLPFRDGHVSWHPAGLNAQAPGTPPLPLREVSPGARVPWADALPQEQSNEVHARSMP
jgi:hypothetical protein